MSSFSVTADLFFVFFLTILVGDLEGRVVRVSRGTIINWDEEKGRKFI